MSYTKITSGFLAISMFMFGILKFIDPFKGWYTVQITNSGLGELSYAMGITGEIFVGLTLLACLIYEKRIKSKTYAIVTTLTFFTIVIMMLTGIFVHLNPNVPAEVLPLKIKPPYIPALFLIVAVSNIIVTLQNYQKEKSKSH